MNMQKFLGVFGPKPKLINIQFIHWLCMRRFCTYEGPETNHLKAFQYFKVIRTNEDDSRKSRLIKLTLCVMLNRQIPMYNVNLSNFSLTVGIIMLVGVFNVISPFITLPEISNIQFKLKHSSTGTLVSILVTGQSDYSQA